MPNRLTPRFLMFFAIPLFSVASSAAATEGCKEFVGWLIYPGNKNSPSLEEEHCGSHKEWILKNKAGAVVDQMPVPGLPKGTVFNYGQCRVNGIYRDDIIAIVAHSARVEWSGKIRKAWLVSPELKIVGASTAGVECHNEGYGVD